MGNAPDTPDTPAQFDLLITRCLDGGEPGDRATLNDLLRRDPAARAAFIEHCQLAALVFECPRAVENSKLETRNSNFRLRRTTAASSSSGSSFEFRVTSLSFAAAIVLLIAGWFIFAPEPRTLNPEPSAPTVAMLTHTDGAVFDRETSSGAGAGDSGGGDSGGGAMTLGSELTPGVIKLAAGNAQIMFNSTAVVDLIGPCEFEMTGPNRGRLMAGSMTAYVPEAAHGFVVEAPVAEGKLEIVDLGTRFGLDVAHEDRACSIVRVIEGEVELRYSGGPAGSDQRRRLGAAEGMIVRDGHFEMLTPLVTPEADPLAGAGTLTALTDGAAFTAGTLSLHPNDFSQIGSVVTRRAMPLRSADGFICTFEFECADGIGTGADWLKFFIASEPPAGVDMAGRNVPSPQILAVTFDSYRNPDEPSAAFVDVATPDRLIARVDLAAAPFDLRDLSDSGPHRVRLQYLAGRLSLSVDGRLIVRDLPLKLERPGGRPLDAVWLGFGARTGGSSELHLVRDCWFGTLSPSPTSRDREGAVMEPHDSASSGPLADARGSLKLPPTPNPQPPAPKHPENGDTP